MCARNAFSRLASNKEMACRHPAHLDHGSRQTSTNVDIGNCSIDASRDSERKSKYTPQQYLVHSCGTDSRIRKFASGLMCSFGTALCKYTHAIQLTENGTSHDPVHIVRNHFFVDDKVSACNWKLACRSIPLLEC